MGYFKNLDIERQEQEDLLAAAPRVESLVITLQALAEATHRKLTTDQAIANIHKSFDTVGAYDFCKARDLLVNNSAEEFAIEFMTFFNAYNGSQVY